MTTCPFCSLDASRIVFADEYVLALDDAYPVSPGHALAVPRRHVVSWFDLSDVERQSLMVMLDLLKQRIEQSAKPDGYNIGINDGPAAGQTVHHVHMHLIPRFDGDVPDPRGGIRWVISGKARYWREG